jgi:peptidoglycan/xylan/chitin deacetylase (PgdA/CDA1 family)
MRPHFKVAKWAARGRLGRAIVAIGVIAAAAALAVPNGVAGRHNRPVPILMYHVIAAPPAGVAFPELFVRPADFARQMQWLAHQGYHAVTLRQVYGYWLTGSPLPSHAVVISFDDGYLSQATEAMPVLHKLHWPGVLNLKVNAVQKYNLPLWRVRALIAAGWEIDAHTITHPDLTTVDDARLWQEIHGSRVALRKMLHVPVDFFCYPSGRYNAHVIDAVRRAGYLGATTTNYGLAQPAKPYELSRVRINGSDGVVGFAHKLESIAP